MTLNVDNEAGLAWLEDAFAYAFTQRRPELWAYLEAVMDDVLFEMELSATQPLWVSTTQPMIVYRSGVEGQGWGFRRMAGVPERRLGCAAGYSRSLLHQPTALGRDARAHDEYVLRGPPARATAGRDPRRAQDRLLRRHLLRRRDRVPSRLTGCRRCLLYRRDSGRHDRVDHPLVHTAYIPGYLPVARGAPRPSRKHNRTGRLMIADDQRSHTRKLKFETWIAHR